MLHLKGFSIGLTPVKIVFCGLSLAIIAWFATLETTQAKTFPDVAADLPEKIAIDALSDAGVIKGYEDGTFKPDQTINRAEALKVILMVFPRNTETAANPSFLDVNDGDWFFEFVKKAITLGIVQGYDDKTFKPEQIVNLAETLKMSLVSAERNLTSNIPDFEHKNIPQSAWFKAYFNYAYEHNLITMDDRGNINPAQAMTRAEFVDLVYRIKESGSGKKFNLAYNWRQVKVRSGIIAKAPLDWEIVEVPTGLILLHRDPTLSQVLNAHTFPYSAQMAIELMQADKSSTADDVLNKIANEYQAVYGLRDLLAEKKQQSGRSVLSIHVPSQGILDYYLYLQDGLVLAAQASYGNSEKKSDFIKTIYFLQKELDYLSLSGQSLPVSDLDNNGGNSGPTETENAIKDAAAKAREQILVEGAGTAVLQLFPDKEIIETDVLGVGTGPVDYYYSAQANITIKLERGANLILDVESGRTSAF